MNLFQSFPSRMKSLCFLGGRAERVRIWFILSSDCTSVYYIQKFISTQVGVIYYTRDSRRFIATVTLYKHSNADTKLIFQVNGCIETGRLGDGWFSLVKFSSSY